MKQKIALLPNGRWAMEINGERSPTARYEEPILFNGHIGFTLYWGDPMHGIHEATALPESHVEVKDESIN